MGKKTKNKNHIKNKLSARSCTCLTEMMILQCWPHLPIASQNQNQKIKTIHSSFFRNDAALRAVKAHLFGSTL